MRAALTGSGARTHPHHHEHTHKQIHAHEHEHGHEHQHGASRGHSHLPPGTDGAPVTWRSLLALGVSGGLLPCPSALVVLLAAISLGRVGYGLLLIVAFSLGLASVLTAIGLVFVYASRRLKLSTGTGKLVQLLPIPSAFVITVIGGIICYQALGQSEVMAASLWATSVLSGNEQVMPFSVISVLGAGLIIGLKHAIEADHLAAVSTIVSERRSLLSSSLIGGLWGIGHTISLLAAGVVVILLQIRIPDRVAQGLEFCVAIMLVGLGINALRKLIRGGRVHLHSHSHGGHAHNHPHLHSASVEPGMQSHHGPGPGLRPLLIGMVHGLAGSAALMLLVLTQISSRSSRPVAFAYIAVFGLGSIGGMMLMSSIIALPATLAARRFSWIHTAIRTAAGCFSLLFGLFMAWEIGYVDGLFR
ncbi:MAG: sulfite exporter TauE/SafE family protein [Acidobacteriota bacterium]